ncbi:MAG: hypothetical protein K2N05_06810 [Muribaculaceae bacterium]|nr:hypothetical protein [Muribaculaceae bacterium]
MKYTKYSEDNLWLRCSFTFVLSFLILMSSCDDGALSDTPIDQPSEENLMETVEVPLNLTVGAGWIIEDDSRTAPPGTGGSLNPIDPSDISSSDDGLEEISQINTVKVIVFRRKVEGESRFVHDISNDTTLFEETGEGVLDDHFGESDFHDKSNHKVFKGKIKKVYGYEYRVIALAYGSETKTAYRDINGKILFDMKDGDNNKFSIDYGQYGYFEDFKAKMRFNEEPFNPNTLPWRDFFGGSSIGGINDIIGTYRNFLLNNHAVDVPQLFYGSCYTLMEGNKSDLIKFSEKNIKGEEVKDLPISGVLFRCMAKVEIRIENPTPHQGHYVNWISLLADKVSTEVGLNSYDDFLPGSSSMKTGIVNTTKNGVFTAVGYQSLSESECKDGKEQRLVAYLLPGKTRLVLRTHHPYSVDTHEYRNSHFKCDDRDWDNAINGTGIVSPDVIDGEFYLRRNHKYVIKIKDLDAFMEDKSYTVPYLN